MNNTSVTRRTVLKAAAAPFVIPIVERLSSAAQAPPNILYIMADDMGYADLSCYGRREYTTPNIDKLAAGGMKFTQAYANSSVCSATRTALLTGRYQYRLPVGLEEPLGLRDLGMPPDHPTLPSLLKKAGYATMLIGKWHLGNPPNYGPLKSGYDHFWGLRGGGADYFTHKIGLKETDPTDLWDDNTRIDPKGYMTDLLGDRAIKAIQDYSQAKKPFFISMHFTAPHWPWEGPEDATVSRQLTSIYHLDGGSQKTFAAMVTRLDFQIGRILKALETSKIANNTIVVFTSDNGGERFSDTWPHTGKKTELLEGGIKVPAIVRWPGHIRPGSVTTQTAMSMDWAPTFWDIAGVKPAADFPPDGISLAPVMTGKATPISRKLFWRYKVNDQHAMRYGDMKWLKIGKNDFLFNVVEDPLERANLKQRQPELYKKLVSEYEAWEATMLPIDPKSASVGFTADQLADHFGVTGK